MIKVITLAPHDPIPGGPGRHVLVLRRFEEDAPREVGVTIVLTGEPDEVVHPINPDGRKMSLMEAIDAAQKVAESEGIGQVFVIDRIQGTRERDILRHEGDHSVHGERLVDEDIEDGEHGSDLRDRRP